MERTTIIALQRCYLKPFTLQSEYARSYSKEIAELASRGLISTKVAGNNYGKIWRVTGAGKALLEFASE